MGIQDRDYMSRSRSTKSNNETAGKNLTIYIIATIAVVLIFFTWKRAQRAEYQKTNQLDRKRAEELQKINEAAIQQKLEAQKKAKQLEEFEKNKPIEQLNVNTATLAQLINIPQINEAIARDLLAKRPFKTWEELDNVYGIGEKKLDALEPYLVIKPETQDPQ